MQTFRYGILPYAIWLVVLGGLVAVEPHLSGAILIMGAGAVLMLVGGINWRWVLGAIGIAALLLYVVLFIIGYNTSRDHLLAGPVGGRPGLRLAAVPEPHHHRLRGPLGVGLGKSRQKFLYLPEEHNDFHLRHHLRGAGPDRGHHHLMLLFAALILRGYWIRPPRPGPVRQPPGGGRSSPWWPCRRS